jgi:hypothetical protein|tara:strand:- start:47 stop:295 length:249 start_codon:yes stop_codon:yes gene_type:complete
MPKNIKEIKMWENNPQKDRISNVVKIDFNFPCTWTILDISDLMNIIREWIKGEEIKYPQSKGFKGRWMLFNEIKKVFDENPK